MQTVLSIAMIYLFILGGVLLKRQFKEEVQEKTLVLLHFYIFAPMIVLWGITLKPLDFSLVTSLSAFLVTTILTFFLVLMVAKVLVPDRKDRAILTILPIISNTGNLGIAVGLFLFGEGSVPYTALMNVAMLGIAYILGAYTYSRGQFSIKDSITNVLKLPFIYATIAALLINYFQVPIHEQLMQVFQMGAYASISISLVVFGMQLYNTKINGDSLRLLNGVLAIKLLLIPFIGFLILSWIDMSDFVKKVTFMELIMPLALINTMLATLYDCKPQTVTKIVFVSSVLGFITIPLWLEIFEIWLGT